MHYVCLRDCYVQGVVWYKGEIYDLPDEFPKAEKNFAPTKRIIAEQAHEPETFAEIQMPDFINQGGKRVKDGVTPDTVANVQEDDVVEEGEPSKEKPLDIPEPEDTTCKECGKECKSILGLHSHSRVHRK